MITGQPPALLTQTAAPAAAALKAGAAAYSKKDLHQLVNQRDEEIRELSSKVEKLEADKKKLRDHLVVVNKQQAALSELIQHHQQVKDACEEAKRQAEREKRARSHAERQLQQLHQLLEVSDAQPRPEPSTATGQQSRAHSHCAPPDAPSVADAVAKLQADLSAERQAKDRAERQLLELRRTAHAGVQSTKREEKLRASLGEAIAARDAAQARAQEELELRARAEAEAEAMRAEVLGLRGQVEQLMHQLREQQRASAQVQSQLTRHASWIAKLEQCALRQPLAAPAALPAAAGEAGPPQQQQQQQQAPGALMPPAVAAAWAAAAAAAAGTTTAEEGELVQPLPAAPEAAPSRSDPSTSAAPQPPAAAAEAAAGGTPSAAATPAPATGIEAPAHAGAPPPPPPPAGGKDAAAAGQATATAAAAAAAVAAAHGQQLEVLQRQIAELQDQSVLVSQELQRWRAAFGAFGLLAGGAAGGGGLAGAELCDSQDLPGLLGPVNRTSGLRGPPLESAARRRHSGTPVATVAGGRAVVGPTKAGATAAAAAAAARSAAAATAAAATAAAAAAAPPAGGSSARSLGQHFAAEDSDSDLRAAVDGAHESFGGLDYDIDIGQDDINGDAAQRPARPAAANGGVGAAVAAAASPPPLPRPQAVQAARGVRDLSAAAAANAAAAAAALQPAAKRRKLSANQPAAAGDTGATARPQTLFYQPPPGRGGGASLAVAATATPHSAGSKEAAATKPRRGRPPKPFDPATALDGIISGPQKVTARTVAAAARKLVEAVQMGKCGPQALTDALQDAVLSCASAGGSATPEDRSAEIYGCDAANAWQAGWATPHARGRNVVRCLLDCAARVDEALPQQHGGGSSDHAMAVDNDDNDDNEDDEGREGVGARGGGRVVTLLAQQLAAFAECADPPEEGEQGGGDADGGGGGGSGAAAAIVTASAAATAARTEHVNQRCAAAAAATLLFKARGAAGRDAFIDLLASIVGSLPAGSGDSSCSTSSSKVTEQLLVALAAVAAWPDALQPARQETDAGAAADEALPLEQQVALQPLHACLRAALQAVCSCAAADVDRHMLCTAAAMKLQQLAVVHRLWRDAPLKAGGSFHNAVASHALGVAYHVARGALDAAAAAAASAAREPTGGRAGDGFAATGGPAAAAGRAARYRIQLSRGLALVCLVSGARWAYLHVLPRLFDWLSSSAVIATSDDCDNDGRQWLLRCIDDVCCTTIESQCKKAACEEDAEAARAAALGVSVQLAATALALAPPAGAGGSPGCALPLGAQCIAASTVLRCMSGMLQARPAGSDDDGDGSGHKSPEQAMLYSRVQQWLQRSGQVAVDRLGADLQQQLSDMGLWQPPWSGVETF